MILPLVLALSAPEPLTPFPPPAYCLKQARFARSYLYRIYQEPNRWTPWGQARDAAAHRCVYVWSWASTLDDNPDPSGLYLPRREALTRLRQWLGDACFFAGRLPPPVPLEYFEEREFPPASKQGAD